MATLVPSFLVVNGAVASASYLNSWFAGGIELSAANVLLGNPTGTTGTTGVSNVQEIPISGNLQFNGSGQLDITSSISVTGISATTGTVTTLNSTTINATTVNASTLSASGTLTGSSIGTTGGITGASLTVTGAIQGASIAVNSIGTTGGITGSSLTVTGAVGAASVSATTFTAQHLGSVNATGATISTGVSGASVTFGAGHNNDSSMGVNLTLGVGSPSANGTVFTATFNANFAVAPIVTISPGNANGSQALKDCFVTSTTSSMSLVAITGSITYWNASSFMFSIHCIQ